MAILLKGITMGLALLFVLFILSLLIFFFNLDMKMSSKMQPLINKWYDHHKRRPLP